MATKRKPADGLSVSRSQYSGLRKMVEAPGVEGIDAQAPNVLYLLNYAQTRNEPSYSKMSNLWPNRGPCLIY
jgi:hypothetical protein